MVVEASRRDKNLQNDSAIYRSMHAIDHFPANL